MFIWNYRCYFKKNKRKNQPKHRPTFPFLKGRVLSAKRGLTARFGMELGVTPSQYALGGDRKTNCNL